MEVLLDKSKEKDLELYKSIENLKEGSMEAFDFIYESTSSDIYRLISMIIYNEMDREDIMNEVYIQIWSSIEKYDTDKPFRAWIHGITMNQISSFKRKNWRIFRIFEKECSTLAKSEVIYEEDMTRFDEKNEILKMLDKLSYKLKSVIILRYYSNHSLKEIADILKIPLGTVKSRHNLAIKQLEVRMRQKNKNEGGFKDNSWILKDN